MLPIPINDAEAVIEAFWDTQLSDLNQYAFKAEKGTGARVVQAWCYVEFSWHRAAPGKPIFSMSRDVDIIIEHYDALRIRCAVPSGAKLTFKAVVDGRKQTIVDGVVGPDRKWEYTGPIEGKRLQRLTITYEAIKGGIGGGTLQWINLVNRQVEQIRQSRSCPYNPDWPKFLKPADEPVEMNPTLGLLFDTRELKALRKKVAHLAFKPFMDRIRAKAQDLVSTAKPEQFVMESSATINRHHRAYDIQRGESDPEYIALVCGFAGIVDGDVEMLRMSARAILAMAHSQYWDECFQEHFPGSFFDNRSFAGFGYAFSCALGLDWAGEVLSEAGRRIILEAVSKKGMSLINKDFVQYEYIFHCNQAPGFSQGRIAGLLAMKSLWPRSQAWIDQAKKDLLESIDLVFNATEDHGGREGPGYVGATLYRALIALTLLARDEGKTLKEITPPELIGCTDFSLMFLSTIGEPGSYIPYGDVQTGFGATYDLDMVSLMAVASGDARWEDIRQAMVNHGVPSKHDSNSSMANLFTLIFTDPPKAPGGVHLPTFCLLPSTGMLESCRQTPEGPIRLQLIGAAQGAGHVHQDKGSFILEAFGDAIAIDRGVLKYGHPSLRLATVAHMHNVLSPAREGEREAEQIRDVLGHPEAWCLPRGSGNEKTLNAEIDTTAVWQGQFKRHLRRICSPDPTIFFIEEQVAFDRARGATFHLHSLYSIEPTGESFVVHGEHADVIVTPTWTVTDSTYGEDFVDAKEQLVNHLAMTSLPGTNFRIVTVLQVIKVGAEKRWEIEFERDKPETIVARGAGETHALEAIIPPGPKKC